MRKFTTNLAFVDLLFNLLVGFTSMFIIAFLMINPVADDGKIDPVIEFIIYAKWDDKLTTDFDMWVRGPDQKVVGYAMKEAPYMTLSRDDLGSANDFFYDENGEQQLIERNIEDVKIRGLVPGEYVVNVHYFSAGKNGKNQNRDVIVTLIDLQPGFREVISVELTLAFKAERTAFVFEVDKQGRVSSVHEDIQIRVRPVNASEP